MSKKLVIDDLHVKRGSREILHGVTLEVAPGSITSLLGSNGAGKSTLVSSIAGLIRPHSGSVTLDGAPITAIAPESVRAAGLAVVPEGHRVLSDLTVEDNLRASLSGLKRRDQRERIDETLTRFPELGERLERQAGLLSGGQQQMLALAQALGSRPRYLVIDELSLGLAPIIVERLSHVLEELAQDGVGILLIEQFTMLALEISARAYVMQTGRIVVEGTAEDLRSNPDKLADAYLSSGFVEQS